MQAAALAISIALQAISLALFLSAACAFVTLVKGCFVLRRLARVSSRDDTLVLLKSPMVPQISVVASVCDALPETRAMVRGLLDLHSAHHEVVLALRGIAPPDLDLWKQEFRLFPTTREVKARAVYEAQPPTRLLVLDLERVSEADGLNAAVRAAGGSVIGCVDPRAELQPEVLLRLLRPMLEDPQGVVACCGTVPPPPTSSLAGRFGALEALRMWLVRCAAFTGWDVVLPVPGAALLVSREALLDAGGFIAGPLELVLQLHGLARTAHKPYHVTFLPEPVSYLHSPGRMAELRAVVVRDQREIALAWRRRGSIAGSARAIGWGLPALIASRVLRPVVETFAYLLLAVGLALRMVPWQVAVLVLLCTVGAGMLVSMSAAMLRELAEYHGSDPASLLSLIFAAIPENLGYRQLRNLWLIGAFFGKKEKEESRGTAIGAGGSAAAVSKGK